MTKNPMMIMIMFHMKKLSTIRRSQHTKRMQEIPIILFGSEYWKTVINFEFLADEGVIADEHLDLIDFVDSAQQAWEIIQKFHNQP